ncbi:UNVERIFIED_CONTAM: Pentatricopeptide repeat-containing protein, chloroplastic [Sesamum angustifolium]|uniref:Pentatricopeptide repeat-containing protein, chloroplastic n=1 Tax=Sesamum angustifolium TaxID=2727405 RepID=A0AAW2LEE3_9LAMI
MAGDSKFNDAWKKLIPNMDPLEPPSAYMSFRHPTQSTILSKLTVNLVLPYHSVLAAKEVSMGCLKNRSHSAKFLTDFGIQLAILKLSYSTSLSLQNLKDMFSEQPTNAAASSTITGEDAPVRKEKPTRKARTMARLINTKPWSARVESCLSNLGPFSETTFFQTLRLIKAPSEALRFFNWAQDSGFNHSHRSYFKMLEILGRARNLNTARNFLFSIPRKSNYTVPLTDKFFNSLIRSYGDAGLLQESMKVFKVMKSMVISPSAVTFNSLFLILLKRGRVAMVFELYDEMLRTYGVKPDLYTFNILIRGFCMNSMVDEAFRMFKEMEKFECEPDLITYNTIVDGLCRAGKVNVAHNVVNGMRKKCESLRPNVVSYTTLIRGYCAKQEIDGAMDVFREMVGNRGFVPDTCTFNTVVNAHCNQENLDEALKVFEKMKEMNVKQDSATYSMLIRTLCRKKKFDKAEELLDELFEQEILLRNDNTTPLAAAYNPIFEYLCTSGKTKKAERVFRQLMKRGLQDPHAFETLILGHCKEGTFVAGHKLLVLMLRRGFVLDVEIYESLVEGLLQNREPDLAHDTLEKMMRSSHLPRTSTFHRVLMELIENGSTNESANLMMLMLDKKIRPNMNLSTDAVRLLFRGSMQNRAFQLVRSLYENGYILNMEDLIFFLCQDRKLSEAFLTSLCKAHKLSEAFHLYYELLEKGIHQPLSCLEGLRNALEAEGKLKEAEFVAKRMFGP